MGKVKDSAGVAGTAKYMYQASRAVRGLSTTTKLTAAVDLVGGAASLESAHNLAEATKGVTTAAKGATGAVKLSKLAKVAKFAGKAAPILTKGSAIISTAVGGYEIGQGINELRAGNHKKATEKIVAGAADVVTAGAVATAATASGTVVGLPAAGVALAVAGAAQGVKYAYKYRGKIAKGAKWAGRKVSQGAKWAKDKAVEGATWAKDKAVKGAKWVKEKGKLASNKLKKSAEYCKDKIQKGYVALKKAMD